MNIDADCTFECDTEELHRLVSSSQLSDNLREGFSGLYNLATKLPRPIVCGLTVSVAEKPKFTGVEFAEEFAQLRQKAVDAGIDEEQADAIVDAVIQGVWDPHLEDEDEDKD